MFSNDPKLRYVVYVIAAVVGGVAIVLEAIPTPWAEQAAGAAQNLGAYLLTLIGITAAANVPKTPTHHGGDIDGGLD